MTRWFWVLLVWTNRWAVCFSECHQIYFKRGKDACRKTTSAKVKKKNVNLHDHVTKFFFCLFVYFLGDDCCCTNVYRSLSVLLYVRCRMLGVQQTNRVPVWVPVWDAPAQEDGDHIPFCVCGCFQRIPWFLSEFQWDLVRVSLATPWVRESPFKQTPHVFSACVCNVSKLLSWGQLDLSTDLGLPCSLSLFIELLIRKSIIPSNEGELCLWIPTN